MKIRPLPHLPMIAFSLLALPCSAHHSAAIFDMKSSIALHGTVRLFQWTNPHCWIQLLVPAQRLRGQGVGGVTAEWSLEMGSPSQLYRNGWRPGTLRPGDEVTILIHPAKDGTSAGEFISGSEPDGAPIRSRASRSSRSSRWSRSAVAQS